MYAFYLLKLQAWAPAAVVNAVVVGRIMLQADPAELKFAFFAHHMIASINFLDRRRAAGALPALLYFYLILNCE